MKYENPDISLVDGSDVTFAFRLPALPQGFAESVARHGVLCPLTVRERRGVLQIVSGRRRFEAAARAGLRNIPCLAFGEEELLDLDALHMLIEENRFGSGFTAIEAGRLMARFEEHGLTAAEIGSGIAPLLGVPTGRESVARHLALASMDPGIAGHPLARDGMLLSLARLPKDALKTLWDAWVAPERPSVQDVRQAVEWLEDLSVKPGAGLAQALADALARSAGRSFLKTLRAARFPDAAAIEERFAGSCTALPRGVRARMTSTDAVEFTVSARDAEDLSAAARTLSEDHGAIEAVFRTAAGE